MSNKHLEEEGEMFPDIHIDIHIRLAFQEACSRFRFFFFFMFKGVVFKALCALFVSQP